MPQVIDPSLAADPLPAPLSSSSPPVAEVVGEDDVRFARGPRSYRVRGLARCLSAESLKVTLRLSSGERLHLDTLDLYQARLRASFAKAAAVELGVAESMSLATCRRWCWRWSRCRRRRSAGRCRRRWRMRCQC